MHEKAHLKLLNALYAERLEITKRGNLQLRQELETIKTCLTKENQRNRLMQNLLRRALKLVAKSNLLRSRGIYPLL